MQEMLAEYKIHTSAIFITELTLYYDEILSKTGGDPPHTKEVKESCWALVTKLLKTILKEIHKVRRFAAEAVSIGSDSLSTNGVNQWDVPVRGPGRTTRPEGVCDLRLA